VVDVQEAPPGGEDTVTVYTAKPAQLVEMKRWEGMVVGEWVQFITM